jgi:hypothetical protein
MEHDFVRYLRLWPDGYWVWKDVEPAQYDFTAFVQSLDPAVVRSVANTSNPPLAGDGGHEYEVGRYQVADGRIVLSLIHRVATTTGLPLEVSWSSVIEIRSANRLWIDAADVPFDFVQDQTDGGMAEPVVSPDRRPST